MLQEANFAATYENPKFDSSQSYIPHSQWPTEAAELYHVRRRRRMLTTLCVLLLLLWLLLATVMGGLLLYRYFLHRVIKNLNKKGDPGRSDRSDHKRKRIS